MATLMLREPPVTGATLPASFFIVESPGAEFYTVRYIILRGTIYLWMQRVKKGYVT